MIKNNHLAMNDRSITLQSLTDEKSFKYMARGLE